MNQAYLHLLFNHLPIIGVVIGFVVFIAGFTLKNPTIKKTALGIFIFSALAVLPAQLTGEGAEEIVEKISGVDHDIIHEHEEQAFIFLWFIGGLGILSLITLFLDWKEKLFAKYFYIFTFLFSLIVIGVGKQTATSGGEIRHPEIKNEGPLQNTENE